ncbi:HNH endonuclease [Enterococcus phage vB_EfaP_Zip]|uniref:HNH endonuclease n=1 Tax=Enterococcus phage vB_EfaP_Zip TaxID=2501743 RepID=A0A411B6V0_9CAUD|nr:HNH endonuclease [Enterococcus phage vB_EfaP_Zip]QAX97326.1 HNH endonuclease [Enterococcus phage vB_EfaP_Zip]
MTLKDNLKNGLNHEKNYMNKKPITWLTCKENDNYEVSELGDVRNKKTKRLLKPKERKSNGYLEVQFHSEGKRSYHYVHRLVANNFIPNPENLAQVNHKDEIKSNNCRFNLEWMSPKENSQYSRGFPIEARDIDGNLVKHFNSLREAIAEGYYTTQIKRSFMFQLPYKGLYFTVKGRLADEYKGV